MCVAQCVYTYTVPTYLCVYGVQYEMCVCVCVCVCVYVHTCTVTYVHMSSKCTCRVHEATHHENDNVQYSLPVVWLRWDRHSQLVRGLHRVAISCASLCTLTYHTLYHCTFADCPTSQHLFSVSNRDVQAHVCCSFSHKVIAVCTFIGH